MRSSHSFQVDAIASALAEAEEADEDGIDPFELLKGGGEGAKEAAAVMLQDAIDMVTSQADPN